MSERLNVSEFARREGCDEKQVRRAITKGLLRKDTDGLLDATLIGSNWRKPNRRTLAKGANNQRTGENNPTLSETVGDVETGAFVARRFVDSGGVELLDYKAALAKKETYLALLRQLEYEQKADALIEMSVAKEVVFELCREQRDAWLAWPSRVGPLIAADLGVDVDLITTRLSEYVYRQLAELGESEASFIGGS
ncbi:hypothetical protein [Paraburkholderia bryophila]|uniref:Uncharacterized protein n=1 Tax=Paraburkholderia bryophila TaxID=420952 RepID=A0A7Y9WPR0_9BURK|nr:hypothetical protein [Paraburkholderia bryophila]NYH23956.1 hypothetical protein [Paraburkholderia bryophila]